MTRLLQRAPSWLPWVLLLVAVVGLLLPWLLAPVASDERYHYPAAPRRMDDNLLNVLPWTMNDAKWRMRSGRIAPIGVLIQHVFYLLGMQFAFATGVPLFVVHGIVKVVLLAAVVGSFALLVAQLRRRDGERIDRPTRTTAVLLFAALLVIGITTTSPGRNGWTTFVVLCIGGIVLMFLAGAASLVALDGWGRWGPRGKALSAAGIVLLGVVIMLSYEMHWAAIPFAVVLLALAGRSRPLHRLALCVALGGGWLGAVLVTRQVIASAATGEIYTGLKPDLGGPVIKVIGLQLVNAVPGSGIPYALYDAGEGLAEPMPFDGTGWLWGALLALAVVLLLRRRRLTTDAGADRAGPDRQPLLALALALATSALAVAVILSVSEQAHRIVRFVGATYRGTPWIWACLAGILAIVLVVLPRTDWGRRVTTATVTATCAVAVGVLVWPTTVSAIQTQRAAADYLIWERAQTELIGGSTDPVSAQHRCLLADQATDWAGDSSYRSAYLDEYEQSYAHQWGRPWCP
ncbi:MAG TPA: hypothetical protein VJN29_03090 [Intrasporangium sp.]|uniref:hypothetical protein n=1 Tax=Intrasporangium sp. TaxID=1925024 RepID=UPI002B4A109E|nr:hypothetical protein [Intrasporangium sp.]HKX66186.1 hypothetical protein [Intrasporangium sp.]